MSWTDADPLASLDAAVGGGSTRLPDGLSALVPAGAVDRGGVLAVDGAGSVRWFGADARKLAASEPRAPPPSTTKTKSKSKSKSAASPATVVECACAVREGGGGGVLVVTAESALGGDRDRDDARVATLYRANGGEHSGRTVEAAWTVEARAPSDAAGRVVAAAASDDELVMLWSDGTWAVYAPRGADPGVPTRSLALGGEGRAAAAKPAKAGKRAAAAKIAAEPTGALPAASIAALGGGYYAVAQVGVGDVGGARVAVIDSRFGAVHSATETHPGSRGAESSVLVAAVGDADAGDAHRLAVCLDGEVVLAEIPAPPPLSLAAVLGSLSAGPAGAAAAKVFGADAAAKMATPPSHAVDAPDLASRVPRGPAAGAVVPAGDPFASDPESDAAARAAAELFAGDAAVTPAAAEKALAPFLSDGAVVPPAVLAAAVDGCARRELWEPLRALVAGGHVASSSTAPDLVRCLLAADRLADLDAFLVSARDVAASDVRRCLDAFLSDGGVSPSALAAVVKIRTAAAEAAVRDAEAAARGRKEKGASGAAAAKAEAEATARARAARVAVAAVEAFDDHPRAALLHALVARPADPSVAAETLPGLSASAAAALASYLSRWLETYAEWAVADATPPPGTPTLAAAVSWTCALIDAHFTSFAVRGKKVGGDGEGEGEEGEALEAMASLRRSADRLRAACESVGRVAGALQHVAEGGPVPENQGVLSTTYSIEVVDW